MRHETLASLLESAMAKEGLSRRGLAVRMAGGTGDKNLIESYRKQVRRMLSGSQATVQSPTAAKLSEALKVPYSYWPTDRGPDRRSPIEVATEFVTRLAAGESLPAGALLEVATDLEEVAAESLRLATALRQASEAARSGP